MKVNFYKPLITGNELTYIADIIENNKAMLGDGEYTHKAQAFLAKRYKINKVLLTTSGTTALELALRLCNLKPGDEVIAPSFTFSSSINAVLLLHEVKVVFADIDKKTLNIDPKDVKRKITKKTKAIMVVHYAGVATDMDAIMQIAKKRKIKVIEDAAQGIEAKWKNKYLGTIGDFGCMSFHATKNITMGEGGALFINTKNKQILEQAEVLREKGTNRHKFLRGEVDKYTWVSIGSSYLPSDLLSAFLFAQLEQIESITKQRLSVYNYYYNSLYQYEEEGLIQLPKIPSYATHNGHVFFILCKNTKDRDEVITYLRKNGITAPFHYIPLHSSPQGKKLGYKASDLPITEKASETLLRLPMYSGMPTEEQDYVVHHVKTILDKLYHVTKPTVTIGIPAYNESANIKHLLTQITKQKQLTFTLEKIIVVSDASSDDTVKKASSLPDKRIKVIDHKTRTGQNKIQNEIFSLSKSAICIILEADTRIPNTNYIATLIAPMTKNKDVSLVQGNPVPLPAKTFIGSTLSLHSQIFHASSANKPEIAEWIANGRGGRAFAKKLYTKLRWPQNVSEDDYGLLWSKTNGFTTVFEKNAKSYYKCSETLSDYLLEIKKAKSIGGMIETYFAPTLTENVFSRPRNMRLKMGATFLIKNPLYFASYIGVKLYANSNVKKMKFTDFWPQISSTKILKNYEK